jgi:hypothetical protein
MPGLLRDPDLRYPFGEVVDGGLAYRLQSQAKNLRDPPTATMKHIVQDSYDLNHRTFLLRLKQPETRATTSIQTISP